MGVELDAHRHAFRLAQHHRWNCAHALRRASGINTRGRWEKRIGNQAHGLGLPAAGRIFERQGVRVVRSLAVAWWDRTSRALEFAWVMEKRG